MTAFPDDRDVAEIEPVSGGVPEAWLRRLEACLGDRTAPAGSRRGRRDREPRPRPAPILLPKAERSRLLADHPEP